MPQADRIPFRLCVHGTMSGRAPRMDRFRAWAAQAVPRSEPHEDAVTESTTGDTISTDSALEEGVLDGMPAELGAEGPPGCRRSRSCSSTSSPSWPSS